jgi:hypothetical protein
MFVVDRRRKRANFMGCDYERIINCLNYDLVYNAPHLNSNLMQMLIAFHAVHFAFQLYMRAPSFAFLISRTLMVFAPHKSMNEIAFIPRFNLLYDWYRQ